VIVRQAEQAQAGLDAMNAQIHDAKTQLDALRHGIKVAEAKARDVIKDANDGAAKIAQQAALSRESVLAEAQSKADFILTKACESADRFAAGWNDSMRTAKASKESAEKEAAQAIAQRDSALAELQSLQAQIDAARAAFSRIAASVN
jgi:multidrug resistance efflux pump